MKRLDVVVKERVGFRNRLEGSISKYKHDSLPTTKVELDRQIMSYEGLKESAINTIENATDVHSKWDTSRRVGPKKVGAKMQRFLDVFSDFLNAYSGIIELLKGAGQVYGQVAYETLSIFLIVRLFTRRRGKRSGR